MLEKMAGGSKLEGATGAKETCGSLINNEVNKYMKKTKFPNRNIRIGKAG